MLLCWTYVGPPSFFCTSFFEVTGFSGNIFFCEGLNWLDLFFSRRAQILIGFWPNKTLKKHPETSMEAWWEPHRALFGNISSHFGGYVEPCRGYVGSKTDQNLSLCEGLRFLALLLPENRLHKPPWNFILYTEPLHTI